MKSMTGFGNSVASAASGVDIHVDIASYNKKQLDIRVSLPNDIASLEVALRKRVAEKVFRGAVNIKIETTPGKTGGCSYFEVNKDLAAAYVKSAKKLKKKLKLAGEIDINEVLNIPGVLAESKNDNLLKEEDLNKVLDNAIDNLLAMRKQEGKELQKDIISRLKALAELLEKIKPLTVSVPELQKERLMNNLKNAGLGFSTDDERVMKEIIIFTDRCDVSEEITRIQSHFAQFALLIKKNTPVGRAMEFMIQELQREINTLGTKAAHSKISPLIVEFKTDLEKIREQVQNVE